MEIQFKLFQKRVKTFLKKGVLMPVLVFTALTASVSAVGNVDSSLVTLGAGGDVYNQAVSCLGLSNVVKQDIYGNSVKAKLSVVNSVFISHFTSDDCKVFLSKKVKNSKVPGSNGGRAEFESSGPGGGPVA